ncbi:MAG TPA: hypothetical protein VGO18_29150, partial [Steroidobacteraceae bacterium]|nr:hypothetical protein [Steroidobacteraceae bacterium]
DEDGFRAKLLETLIHGAPQGPGSMTGHGRNRHALQASSNTASRRQLSLMRLMTMFRYRSVTAAPSADAAGRF